MKTSYRKVLIAAGIALLSVVLTLVSTPLPLLQRWEHQTRDILYRDFQPLKAPEEVVIVAIDQNSLDHFYHQYQVTWPFPREFYGALLEYLTYCQSRMVAFDIILSLPDIDRATIQADYSDQFFAEQMARHGSVVLAAQMEDSSNITKAVIHPNPQRPLEYDSFPPTLIASHTNATLPLFQFQGTMALAGAVNFHTDEDAICRRVPMMFRYDDTYYPYMALAAVAVYDSSTTIGFDPQTHSIVTAKHRIPVDPQGQYEIYWYGPGGPRQTFTYVSIAQVIHSFYQWKMGQEPFLPPEFFRGKAVFVGSIAAGLLDLKSTPLSSADLPYPGVEIYATVFANIISSHFVSHLPVALWTMVMLAVLFGLSLAWQYMRLSLAALISLLPISVSLLVTVTVFRQWQMFWPIISTEMAILLTIISALAINYLTEGREKRMVKKVFNRYLHPTVVESLTRNPETVQMGGKEIEATVMFSDLQGFTTISELFTPYEIVKFLNEYFEKVEKIIFQNNGMLDKYTGDGIMAIFGAPLENRDHARMSCLAALGFKDLSALSIQTGNHSIPLITRLGINSGRIVVGNIGSSNRMDYTAIGDTVNLSARLEGVNKVYSTQNIISESTYEFVKDCIVCRELDFIRVKGRDKPLRIYSVIAQQGQADAATLHFLELHQQALDLYRQRDYRQAARVYTELLDLQPGDSVAKLFQSRCDHLIREPNLLDEAGIFNIKEK